MTLDDYGTDPAGSDPDRATLSGHDVEAELLADWRVMFHELHARFTTADFASALALVDAIGAAAEAADHHPDLALSWGRVDVRLSSHDVGGLTQRDVRLAREISDLAGKQGAAAQPADLSVIELGLDTPDLEAVKPFWAALLGYEETSDLREVRDPSGTRTTLWFQETDTGSDAGSEAASEGGRTEPEQRFHLDIRVPPEVAERRVQAAVDAGGTLVSDERAPTFWVVADAQGNRACVTTWIGRG